MKEDNCSDGEMNSNPTGRPLRQRTDGVPSVSNTSASIPIAFGEYIEQSVSNPPSGNPSTVMERVYQNELSAEAQTHLEATMTNMDRSQDGCNSLVTYCSLSKSTGLLVLLSLLTVVALVGGLCGGGVCSQRMRGGTPEKDPQQLPLGGLYCGSTFFTASLCETACPSGADIDCPVGQTCFSDVSCRSPSATNFCGSTSLTAEKCLSVACPKGFDIECPGGERCFAGIRCP